MLLSALSMNQVKHICVLKYNKTVENIHFKIIEKWKCDDIILFKTH